MTMMDGNADDMMMILMTMVTSTMMLMRPMRRVINMLDGDDDDDDNGQQIVQWPLGHRDAPWRTQFTNTNDKAAHINKTDRIRMVHSAE